MNRKLIFYSRSGQMRLYPLMANLLVDFESSHIVQNHAEYNVVRSICPNAHIYNLTDFIEKNWENQIELNQINLGFIETTYQINSIWKIFYTDRFLTKYNYSDSVRFIKLHYLFIKTVLSNEQPDYLINEEVALFSSYLFYKICKFHGCKYIGFSVPRNFTYHKVLFTLDEFTHYHELDFYYKANKLTIKEIEYAEAVLNNLRIQKLKPEYMISQGQKPRFKAYYFLALIRALINLIPSNKKSLDYTVGNKSKTSFKELLFFIRYLRQKKYYVKLVENEQFILFPLHFQPEASTLVKATDFENQINTIEILAKNIPGEYILYVKEHYAKLGHRNMYFYRQIKRFPNVRLIDPWVDSHLLIQKCQAVIVLSSTAGWEALIYGKPVFILGNVFYETFKYALKVNNIYGLAAIIKNSLKDFQNNTTDFKEDFNRYFAAYLKAMHEGNYVLSSAIDDDNIKKLCNALVQEIKLLESFYVK